MQINQGEAAQSPCSGQTPVIIQQKQTKQLTKATTSQPQLDTVNTVCDRPQLITH